MTGTYWRENLRYSFSLPMVRMGIFAATVSMAALLAQGILAWWPVYRESVRLHASLGAGSTALIAGMNYQTLLEKAQAVLPRIENLEKKLAARGSHGALMENLGALAGRNKLVILSESFEEGRKSQDVDTVYQNLVLAGSYRGMRNLLLEITALPTWTMVDSAVLERDAGGESTMRANLRFVTFRVAGGHVTKGE